MKKNFKNKKRVEKIFASLQIYLMLMSLFAFSFVISEAGLVSGLDPRITSVPIKEGCWVFFSCAVGDKYTFKSPTKTIQFDLKDDQGISNPSKTYINQFLDNPSADALQMIKTQPDIPIPLIKKLQEIRDAAIEKTSSVGADIIGEVGDDALIGGAGSDVVTTFLDKNTILINNEGADEITATPSPVSGISGSGSATAKASSDLTKKIDSILGGTTTSSGATGTLGLTNYDKEITFTTKTALENAGMSDIQLNADNKLKSFVQGDKLYNVGTDGALTSQNIKSTSLFGQTFTGISAHLLQGALWAAGIIGAIQLLGPMFGASEEQVDAATKSALVGVVVWKGLDVLAASELFTKEQLPTWIQNTCATGGLAGGLGWCSIGIGVAAALITFLLLYSEEEEKIVKFTCLPWQAPLGGGACEECNKQGDLSCSEYQCRSLGQACQIINSGTNEEKCAWVNRQDVNPPTIEPLQDALLNNYRYAPDGAINPPDRGVKINYLKANNNCVPAFTPLQFGVKLNEPASCRVDVLRKGNFSEMSSLMSSGMLRYNHTYALSLPGTSALEQENITVQNNGNYALYVRCQDANGNSNPATFVFKYCVDPGPDTTPAVIVATSIVNKNPIAFNKSSVDLEVYTNEPASCKWSHNNQDYDSMEETMQCSSSIFEANAQMLYKCSTSLTGLKNKVENKFYFRCKDQPLAEGSKRNENSESYEFSLMGTQPLVIDSAKPKDTIIKDSTSPVKVKINATTSAGFDEGKAICYYSSTGNEESYIKFFETDSFKHSQDLFLTNGNYNYFIKCTDLGGNSDYEKINFSVETDTSSPTVVRVYKEDNYLKLITSESAECVYSTFECNYAFAEGTKITSLSDKVHFTPWTAQKDLYVKCEDDFGNQPIPDKCSIIVRAASNI